MLFDPLAITTPIAGFNGGLFVKRDLTIIESRTIDPGRGEADGRADREGRARRLGVCRR